MQAGRRGSPRGLLVARSTRIWKDELCIIIVDILSPAHLVDYASVSGTPSLYAAQETSPWYVDGLEIRTALSTGNRPETVHHNSLYVMTPYVQRPLWSDLAPW